MEGCPRVVRLPSLLQPLLEQLAWCLEIHESHRAKVGAQRVALVGLQGGIRDDDMLAAVHRAPHHRTQVAETRSTRIAVDEQPAQVSR